MSGGSTVVFDRLAGKYFRAPVEVLPSSVREAARSERSLVPPWCAWAIVATLPALVLANFLLLPRTSHPTHALGTTLAVLYLAASVVVHEFAHFIALRAFGRRPDGFGFKLNHYVFPAFYVRMNQSLLLSRPEQVVVHASGVAVNLVTNAVVLAVNAVTVRSAALDVAAQLTFIAVVWNVVPMLNSDGYRVMLALTRTDATRRLDANPRWLIVVKAFGIVFILFVVIKTVITITRNLIG